MKENPRVALVKFNSGMGALLCNWCRVIIDYGFDHEDKLHFCSQEHAERYASKQGAIDE